MLIKRTIDRPDVKLNLLVNYLIENNLFNAILNYKTSESLVSITHHYIEEGKLCSVLQINKNTLRQWNILNNNRLMFHFNDYFLASAHIHYDLKVNSNHSQFSEIRKKNYYALFNVLYFLCSQAYLRRMLKEF